MNNMENDQAIAQYILQYETDHYEKILKKDNRWDVFYHLSQMRTSLLNWYDFKKNSRMLEIGGGFGAITGLLCRRCKQVVTVEQSERRAAAICQRYKNIENLQVLAGRWADEKVGKNQFDYIFLNCEEFFRNDSLSPADFIEWLKKFKKNLKADGKLLMAVENRYGIKYFCGEEEPKSGLPFAGINMREEAASYLCSRGQIVDMVQSAGFPAYKFYYPLPGNQFPQLIYSDEKLPDTDVCERLVFYYRNRECLLASEKKLYGDLLANNVFPFFSNSFLIECGEKDDFCSVIYAAVSTDRGRKDSFSTKIYSQGLVKKSALYPEGKESEDHIFCNLKELESRDIKIVPHQKTEDGLAMPFINSPTCSDYLRRLARKGNKEEIITLFERLYQAILKSSEHEPESQNQFPLKNEVDCDFGIILKKAYIDMVPFNCFFINNEMVFFDQEFVRCHYPASYTLFRALKYTYLSIPEIENLIPLESFKNRYGLEKLWGVFSREEDRFVAENRRYDVYGTFYSWTWIDEKQITENAEKLIKYGQS